MHLPPLPARHRAALLALLLAVGCAEDPTSPPVGPPARVVIEGAPDTMLVDEQVQLRAVVMDASGDTIPEPDVIWVSGTPGYLSIQSSGLLVAHNAGTARITARSGDREASVAITARRVAFASVALGTGVSCGIDQDRRLWCWGDLTALGLLPPDGEYHLVSNRPVPVYAGSRFHQVALGGRPCAIVEGSVEVTCWDLESGNAAPVPGTSGANKVVNSRSHSCALLASGGVACWGDNYSGQLGDGTRTSRADARPVAGITDAVDMKVGGHNVGGHSCALRASGDLWCWGGNGHMQLGADTTYDVSVPQVVPGVRATNVTGDGTITCAEGSSPNLMCWGWWSFWHSSRGGYEAAQEQLPVILRGIAAVADHACGLDGNGAAWCWGADDEGQLGRGSYGRTNVEYPPAPVATTLRFASLSVMWSGSCGLTASGDAWCWGDLGVSGGSQASGHVSPVPIRVPAEGPLRAWKVSEFVGCGLDVSGRAWCIMNYGSGSLQQIVAPDDVTFDLLEVGPGFACGLTPEGQAWCWGSGPFGDGELSGSHVNAVPVGGSLRFSAIAPGSRHACGVERGSGQVHCWGRNEQGQLGDGTTEPRVIPVPAQLSGAVGVVAFWRGNTCAWDTMEAVYCWGSAVGGALGSGVRLDSPVPLHATKLGTVADFDLEGAATCSLDPSGAAICVGQHPGDIWTANSPAVFTSVVSGDQHSCGLTPQGTAWCWGFGLYGRLGNGELDGYYRWTPVEVRGGRRFKELFAGAEHTCGMSVDDILWCWGANRNGEVGNGSRTDYGGGIAEPVRVLGQ